MVSLPSGCLTQSLVQDLRDSAKELGAAKELEWPALRRVLHVFRSLQGILAYLHYLLGVLSFYAIAANRGKEGKDGIVYQALMGSRLVLQAPLPRTKSPELLARLAVLQKQADQREYDRMVHDVTQTVPPFLFTGLSPACAQFCIVFAHTHTHTLHTHTYIYTYIYTHIYTHIYIHICLHFHEPHFQEREAEALREGGLVTYRQQLSFGAHVLVMMGTFYALGHAGAVALDAAPAMVSLSYFVI